jgi:hypothetical protein
VSRSNEPSLKEGIPWNSHVLLWGILGPKRKFAHLMPDGEVSQGHDLDPAQAHFKQEPGLDPPDFIFIHLCTVMYCPFCTSYYS